MGRFGFGFTCEGGSGVGLVLVAWDLIEDLL